MWCNPTLQSTHCWLLWVILHYDQPSLIHDYLAPSIHHCPLWPTLIMIGPPFCSQSSFRSHDSTICIECLAVARATWQSETGSKHVQRSNGMSQPIAHRFTSLVFFDDFSRWLEIWRSHQFTWSIRPRHSELDIWRSAYNTWIMVLLGSSWVIWSHIKLTIY